VNPTLRLNGDWVGQGATPSQAAWQLHVQGRHASLAQFNENQPQQVARYDCRLSETPFTFTFGEPCEEFIGFALGESHFVITGLDEGNDVIFSRPGLAELTANEAYDHITPSPEDRFSLSRWAAA
jgi:hypothetical protein